MIDALHVRFTSNPRNQSDVASAKREDGRAPRRVVGAFIYSGSFVSHATKISAFPVVHARRHVFPRAARTLESSRDASRRSIYIFPAQPAARARMIFALRQNALRAVSRFRNLQQTFPDLIRATIIRYRLYIIYNSGCCYIAHLRNSGCRRSFPLLRFIIPVSRYCCEYDVIGGHFLISSTPLGVRLISDISCT
jgi:hypothetical protein